MNPKKKAVLDHIKRLEKAIARGHEYLESGKHADWRGFQPMFDAKVRDGKRLPPHRDWVKNVFLPRRERALRDAEKTLERLEEKVPSRFERRKMMENRDPYKLVKPVRDVLFRDWDPIGCGVPEDEYDSYVPEIIRLLLQGAEAQQISDHLYMLETSKMGSPGNRKRNARVAAKLLSLMDDSRSR